MFVSVILLNLITIKVKMTINVEHLEENEIMSLYSPYVKQNDVSNSVMLELSPRLLNHAKEVADALNEKYHENGGKPNGYTNLFGVLESMLDIQLENETGQSLCVTDPLIPTVYSTQLPDASRR